MNLHEKLEKLKTQSFKYAQKNPEVPNKYDLRISKLFAEAKKQGIQLSEEGHTSKP